MVSENDRTLAAADALRQRDLRTMGKLFAASHLSMQRDFEITTPVIDGLAGLISDELGGEGGARMTGGGFGGCVIAVLPQDRAEAVRRRIRSAYRTPAGERPWTLVCRPASGAKQL